MNYYEQTQPDYVVNVLGSEYSVYANVARNDDPLFEDRDGYCDKTARRIVVAGMDAGNELADFAVYQMTNLRHELIHAFLFESGLDGNSHWDNGESDHPEQVVEWIALQFPKILKAFQAVDAL